MSTDISLSDLSDLSSVSDIPLGISRKPRGLSTLPDLTFSGKTKKFRLSDVALAKTGAVEIGGYSFKRHISGAILMAVADAANSQLSTLGRTGKPRESFQHPGLEMMIGNPEGNKYFNLKSIGQVGQTHWYAVEELSSEQSAQVSTEGSEQTEDTTPVGQPETQFAGESI